MRILYDSKQTIYKFPFGPLVPNQNCTLNVHVPATVRASRVICILNRDGDSSSQNIYRERKQRQGPYYIFCGEFSLSDPGLFFYYFFVENPDGGFRLFKQGDDTNMEAGDLWQLSCIPRDFHTPEWARGATYYQIFPDRFHRSGFCDLTGKLRPYTVHQYWYEDVHWQPTQEGIVLNNDFYGGNFQGITEKMDYIASMGTTMLYLNPICQSFSSNRYATGASQTPDPMLGTEADFTRMCQAAHDRGIRVILDGVFSHTGSNSLYFNRDGAFPSNGAYQDPDSPYRSWYTFYHWPDSYNCWWNFDTLPTVNKMEPSFLDYIITGEDSVVAHWLRLGADCYRLDVADELPDEFIRLLRHRAHEIKPDALILGEVWEDASNKCAYGQRRTYFTQGELDAVMNYPFRTAIINYVRGIDGGKALKDTVMSIVENYPPEVVLCNMNMLGTHDTPRILTALVDDFQGERKEQSKRHLSRNQMDVALDRLLTASFLQYTLPGSPCLYYGDEAGMEGHRDPFNRRPFPWGQEDKELQAHFRRLGQLRKRYEAFRLGDIHFCKAQDKHLGFTRSYRGKTFHVYCNRSGDAWEIPFGRPVFGYNLQILAPDCLTIGPRGFCVTEG